MSIERRTIACEFRAASEATDGRTFGGLAARFMSQAYIGARKQGFFEQIDPAAFHRALKENQNVRALWNHNPDHLLGTTAAGTLRLSVTDEGLADEVDLPPTGAGNDVAVLAGRGDITGQSFTFRVNQGGEKWAPMPGGHAQLRTLTDVDLLDVSPVTFPAYQDTTAAIRSADMLIGAARERREGGRDIPVGKNVAAAEAAVDAAEIALAAGNPAQAADCMNAACAAVYAAQCGLWDVNTDLLSALGLPDLCALVGTAEAAVEAACASANSGSPDAAALAAAELALEACMAALHIPDPDEDSPLPGQPPHPEEDTTPTDEAGERGAPISIHIARHRGLALLNNLPVKESK